MAKTQSSKSWREKVASASKRWMLREQVYDFKLSTREIAGSLQFTDGGTFMWFVLGAQQWDFLPHGRRLGLWDQQTYRYSALTQLTGGETPIRLRGTTRPYPAYEYARSLDEQTATPLPTAAGVAETWDDFLGYGQRRLQSTGLDQKLVMMAVRIGDLPSRHVHDELLYGTDQPDLATVDLIERMNKAEQIMAGSGFTGRPATPKDMAFLFHRSLSMGVPAPVTAGVGGERWEVDDLAEFVDAREWHHAPLDPVVRIESLVNGHKVERYVGVVSMGIMPDQGWPENGRDPWMLALTRLPFPVEWSISGVLLSSKTLEKAITFEQNRAEGIQAHYMEHGLTPPPAVARAIRGAVANLDEVTEGDARAAARFLGTIRMAVVGTTEDQARRRAADLVDFYGDKMKMPLHFSRDSALALREFVPGEPRSRHGYQRRMPVKYLAAALPNVDQKVGTPTGPYFAYTSGSSRRAARFDMWYGPERLQRSGLFPIVSEPGGGKSVMLGVLSYSSVRCGVDTIILDPSGPLAKLCDLPELKPFARVLDLTNSDPGTLSPYLMVPEVIRSDFEDADGFNEVEYDRAVRRARAERQQLMFDVLRMWLPSTLLRQAGTDVILRDAIRAAAAEAHERGVPDTATNPRWVRDKLEEIALGVGGHTTLRRNRRIKALVLDHLRRRPLKKRDEKLIASLAAAPPLEVSRWADEHAKKHGITFPAEEFGGSELAQHILDEIDAAAEFPLGELIMPPTREPIPDDDLEKSKLVVITMPGLSAPPEGVEREFWGSEERYTQPLLHLAAFFASKFIYSRPRSVRKALFLDENQLMAQWGSGRAFFVRVGRDSRKYDTAVGAASQHPDDHLQIARMEALMSGAFVGRLQKEEPAKKACRLLGAPEEYATVIQGLSPSRIKVGEDGETPVENEAAAESGEFVWLDPLGQLAKIRVDMDWHPSLRKALMTTPGRPRPAQPIVDQPTPFLDPELFETIPIIPIEADTEADGARPRRLASDEGSAA